MEDYSKCRTRLQSTFRHNKLREFNVGGRILKTGARLIGYRQAAPIGRLRIPFTLALVKRSTLTLRRSTLTLRRGDSLVTVSVVVDIARERFLGRRAELDRILRRSALRCGRLRLLLTWLSSDVLRRLCSANTVDCHGDFSLKVHIGMSAEN